MSLAERLHTRDNHIFLCVLLCRPPPSIKLVQQRMAYFRAERRSYMARRWN